MRKYTTITFLLAIAGFVFLTSSVKSYRVYEAESLLKLLLEKMIYIEGEELLYGYNDVPKLQASDTMLLSNIGQTFRCSVSSFYLDATEITNLDWWEFYNYKVHEIGKDKANLLY